MEKEKRILADAVLSIIFSIGFIAAAMFFVLPLLGAFLPADEFWLIIIIQGIQLAVILFFGMQLCRMKEKDK